MSNPSPSAGSVWKDFAEQVGELANCTCDLSPDQMANKLTSLAHAMLTAAPAPVLVIELDQKITPLTKDNHPEQEVSQLSDLPDFGDHIVDFTSGGHTTQLSCRYMAPGLTFQDITEIFYEAEKSLGATDRLSANPSKWPNMRGLLAVTVAIVRTMANAAPLSDPSPAVLNEELVRALEAAQQIVMAFTGDLSEVSREDANSGRCDAVAWSVQKMVRDALSRSKPSP